VNYSFGYLEKENVITCNLKNTLTCGILADPVTYRLINGRGFDMATAGI